MKRHRFVVLLHRAASLARSRTCRRVATFLLLLAAVSVHAQQGPGFALCFDSSSNFVAVPHTAALNAFPVTVMAWGQTTQNAG